MYLPILSTSLARSILFCVTLPYFVCVLWYYPFCTLPFEVSCPNSLSFFCLRYLKDQLMMLPCRFDRSENPNMVGVERDPLRSSSPIPLLRKGHPQELNVQVGLKSLQRKRLHNLSRQSAPWLHHPHIKERCLPAQLEPPGF